MPQTSIRRPVKSTLVQAPTSTPANTRDARPLQLCLLTAAFTLLAPAYPQSPAYFEFGTVVGIGQRGIDIKTFDPQQRRTVQHSFVFASNSRADVVRLGDSVEVIYTPGSTPAAEWTIRRLLLLDASIPTAGPPSGDHRDVPAPITIRASPPLSSPSARAAAPSPTAPIRSAARPSSPPAAPGSVAITSAPAPPKPATPAKSVDLASAPPPKSSAPASSITLGGADPTIPRPIKPTEVAHEAPIAECHRSSADWPSQPLRLAVLDFRYPTEREESHDTGTTGGGSGTAVADLVYASLDQLNQFTMQRGDRTRLYRADFAGAARAGRELGADAVLAGTFSPLDPPPGADPDFPPPKTYELRAGVVDTCTGQLLLRLISVACPNGLDPNQPVNAPSCQRFTVTARQAADPKDQARAFAAPIAALLSPLEPNGPATPPSASSGVVTQIAGDSVTLKLSPGAALKPGDQLALRASRLAKNPSTYTLHTLHDEIIGRVTIETSRGGLATGTFLGDFPPRPGDVAELVTQ